MKIFYGAAIQGGHQRGERSKLHSKIISFIRAEECDVQSEHVTGESYDDVTTYLEKCIGPLPEKGPKRTTFIRNKMIEFVEGEIDAAIFEASVPSLGTGIEISHAYLRPRMGLAEIPILILYEKDFWPNGLSSMIRGIAPDVAPKFRIHEYADLADANQAIHSFLHSF